MASSSIKDPEKPTVCLQTSLPLLQASESAEIQNAVTTLQKIYRESDTVNKQLIEEIQSLVSRVSSSRQQSSSLVSPLPIPGVASTSTVPATTTTVPYVAPLPQLPATTTAVPYVAPLPQVPATTTAVPYVAPLPQVPATTTVAPFAPPPGLNIEEEMAVGNSENFSNLNLSQFGGRRRRAYTSARRNQRNRRKTTRQRR